MRRTLVTGLLLAAVAGCAVVDPNCSDGRSYTVKQDTPPSAVPTWPQQPGSSGMVRSGMPSGTSTSPFAVKPPPPLPPLQTVSGSAVNPMTTQLAANYPPPPSTRPPLVAAQPTPPVITNPEKPADSVIQSANYNETVRSDPDGLSATTVPPHDVLPPVLPLQVPPAGVAVEHQPLPSGTAAEHQPLPATAEHLPSPEIQPVAPVSVSGVPAMRLVNTKRFTLNYDIKDNGAGGPPPVDLWCTQDMRQWKKWEATAQGTHAYVVEVKDEGTYGFTLVARTGPGGTRAPVAGDTPQVWVTVDVTKPVVQMTGLELSLTAKVPSLILRWTARDKNFGPRPVTLSYAVQPEGPWTLIAANVENNGLYEWALPQNSPTSMIVRIEAADLVGNTGTAQTPKAIRIDANWVSATNPAPEPPKVSKQTPKPLPEPAPQPAASIVNVEVNAVPPPAPKD